MDRRLVNPTVIIGAASMRRNLTIKMGINIGSLTYDLSFY
jgi:hypothetical protein